MRIYYLLILCFLIGSLFYACNSKDQKAKDKYLIEGTVFQFGPHIDSVKCEVTIECDCCSDDILFINSQEFLRISYCMQDKTVTKGKYLLSNNNLILHYDSTIYYTEYDKTNNLVNKETGILPADTLIKIECDKKLFFRFINEPLYGTVSSVSSIDSLSDMLKKEGFDNAIKNTPYINTEETQKKSDISDDLHKDKINNAIISFYNNLFKREKKYYPKGKFTHENTEEGIEIRRVLDTTDISSSINIIPFSSKFLKGDMNRDNIEDVIVPVYSTEGGSAEWNEYFVFISKKDDLSLFKMYSSYDLANCNPNIENGAKFFPEKIENGILQGFSFCYAEKDRRCCPSIKTVTKYSFENGLKLLNK